MDITRDEAQEIAEAAVETVLLRMGIDVKDPDALSRLRDDLGFLSRMNRGAIEARRTIIKTCVGALVTGVIAVIVIGVKDWLARKGVAPPV